MHVQAPCKLKNYSLEGAKPKISRREAPSEPFPLWVALL